ncbi:MAG: MerR family transcriptional regulator [Myxococcales bacterium]|nr:MerR family transcriptional regulator [Myxococcales bacterium]
MLTTKVVDHPKGLGCLDHSATHLATDLTSVPAPDPLAPAIPPMPAALTEAQIREIEAAFPEGLSSQQLVSAFADHDVRFSEANLRRYVQLGLVPRSRRVGHKGKHLGSHGVYPLRAVRRINAIKKLMAERYTIEEIQAKFLTFKDSIENLEEAIDDLVRAFEEKLESEAPSPRRDRLSDELRAIQGSARELVTGVYRLEKMLMAAQGSRRPRGGGAAAPPPLR